MYRDIVVVVWVKTLRLVIPVTPRIFIVSETFNPIDDMSLPLPP